MMRTRQQNRKKLIHALAEICGVRTSGFVFSSLLEEEEEDGLAEDEDEDEELEGFEDEDDEEGLADEEEEDDGREEEEEEDFEADGSEGIMLNGSATDVEMTPRKTRISIGMAMRCSSGEGPASGGSDCRVDDSRVELYESRVSYFQSG